MNQSTNEAQAIKKIQQCRKHYEEDWEIQHAEADAVLCQFLIELGYKKLVSEWKKVDKWYA